MHHAAHPPHGASRPQATTTCRRDGYERHRPEDGALYRTIAAHWPAFDEEMEAHGGRSVFAHSNGAPKCYSAWKASDVRSLELSPPFNALTRPCASTSTYVLVLDGVYVRDATTRTLVFNQLPTPTTVQVADIAKRTAQRLDSCYAPRVAV